MTKNTTRRGVGHVERKPNGRWLARISCGYTVDGKRRTASRTFDTEREAEAWLRAKSVELANAADAPHGVTLRMAWPAYQRGKDVTAKTLQAYGWYVERLWMPLLGDVDMAEIAPATVQRAIGELTHENAKHAKNALSSVLTYAAQRGWIAANPLRGHRFEFPRKAREDFDADPFAAIERTREVWSIETVTRCIPLIRGLPLEPAWLCCVGAGLRVEEALALRRMDVRRIAVGTREVGGRTEPVMVTQLAVHAARTSVDGRKGTKTEKGARIVGMIEALGERLWEIVDALDSPDALLCPVSAANQNKRWRGYFEPAPTSKHVPKRTATYKGRLASLPYLPLSKMRNTHVTLMAEVGVSDSINALMHGHSEMVERRHYLSPDMTSATVQASERLRLVV